MANWTIWSKEDGLFFFQQRKVTKDFLQKLDVGQGRYQKLTKSLNIRNAVLAIVPAATGLLGVLSNDTVARGIDIVGGTVGTAVSYDSLNKRINGYRGSLLKGLTETTVRNKFDTEERFANTAQQVISDDPESPQAAILKRILRTNEVPDMKISTLQALWAVKSRMPKGNH